MFLIAFLRSSFSFDAKLDMNVVKSRLNPRISAELMTDFTQLPDAPISNESKIEFLNFRSHLRDMFEAENIFSVSWPVIPSSANNINLPPFPPIISCN